MLTLYDYLPSGNCYKVRLLLTQLGISFKRKGLDIVAGETRTSEFLAKFPNGRVPAVEFEDGTLLFESNAILWYFAEGTGLLAADRLERARLLQWMFFEQYNHEPNIASRRFLLMYPRVQDERRVLMDRMLRGGYEALNVMESHLASNEFFVAGGYTIADICLDAYTRVADEGGFDLSAFAAIRTWLGQMRAQPGHIRIDDAGVGQR
jgi:glutathione S-transferase